MSALALGVKLKQHRAALITGIIGTLISVAAANNFVATYTNFLYLLGYWIMPWISITLLCHYTNRRSALGQSQRRLHQLDRHPILSEPFWNQTIHTGRFAATHPQFGDSTFIVSFVLAGILS